MRSAKTVFLTFGKYETQYYFNSDNDYGVEVLENGNYLGKIVGLEIPESDDEDENINFDEEVEEWIIYNKH